MTEEQRKKRTWKSLPRRPVKTLEDAIHRITYELECLIDDYDDNPNLEDIKSLDYVMSILGYSRNRDTYTKEYIPNEE